MQMSPPRPRRHFAITAPSSLVLLACVFLPSYHDCGHDHLMNEEPPTLLVGPWGVLALLLAIGLMRRRGELVTACIVLALSFLYTGVLAFGMVVTQPLVGLALAFAAMLALAVGGVVWIGEISWKTPPPRRIVFAIAGAMVAIYAAIWAFAPQSLPSEDGNIDRMFVVH